MSSTQTSRTPAYGPARRPRRQGGRAYGPDRDPVARHIGEPWIDRALRKVLKPPEVRLLSDCLWGAPPDQIGRRMGIDETDVQRLVAALLHRIKTSEYGPALLEELRSSGGPRFSRLLWEGRKGVPVHRCERAGCTAPPFLQRATGRARHFCSDACKQAAYRQRRKAKEAATPTTPKQRPTPTPRPQGYLLRAYDDVPELPAPRREQGWFFQYVQRRMRSLTEPATFYPGYPGPLARPQGTGRRALLTFISSRSIPALYKALPRPSATFWLSYSGLMVDEAHRSSLLGRFGLGSLSARRAALSGNAHKTVLRPSPTLTSPLEAPVPGRGPVPRVFCPVPSARLPLLSPPASGPPPQPRYPSTTPIRSRSHVPMRRRHTRRRR